MPREWDKFHTTILMVSTIIMENAIIIELKMRALMKLLMVGLRGETD